MRKGLILSGIFRLSQNKEREKGEFLTGKDWNEWDDGLKVGYVIGIRDGIDIAISHAECSKSKDLLPTGFNYGEFVRGLDAFYGDSSNVRIAIHYAYRYVVKKFNGSSPEELARDVVTLRTAFNSDTIKK